MEGDQKRKYSCCFTGHRPEKLHAPEALIIKQLDDAIQSAINNGYSAFITGMAKGVDIWAAELVLKYRCIHPQIKLICAIPYKGFGLHWDKDWTGRFSQIIQQADAVHYICPKFSYGAYQTRNIWMVDHSALVIAVFNGSSGGTWNTIAYAQKQSGCVIQYITSATP